MKPLFSLLLLVVLSTVAVAQSNTTFYANTEKSLGILTGWEERSSTVYFNKIMDLPYSTGGIAVYEDRAYAVEYTNNNRFYSFNLSGDPDYQTYTTGGEALDALVYDPYNHIMYGTGDDGMVYTYTPEGVVTEIGFLIGLNASGVETVWGSHGDFALTPDGREIYHAASNVGSTSPHVLVKMSVDDITHAEYIGVIPTDYGRVWGMAFDNETGSLFAVTHTSHMLEINPNNGAILWAAPVVDSVTNSSLSFWDLASYTTPVPEPSSALLVGLVGVLGLTIRRR